MTDYSKAKDAHIEKVEGYAFDTIPAQGHLPLVQWEYPEFQSVCPISGRHDQGTLIITYQPKKLLLESKSVRNYLSAWRNKSIWQEFVTDVIAQDLFDAVKPVWLKVEIKWAPRGGIFATTISVKGKANYNA
ncbi:MAG: preQ(1) synthase [Spirochaetes bacterium]|nr:preQ(1) synthase [Spirochaetota bacterium]